MFNSRLILCALMATGVALAQSTFGSFVGTVRDPSGGAMAECKVTAFNPATAANRSTVTDSNGGYNLVNLEPGTYQITMESPGFQRQIYKNLELDSRQTIRVNGVLLVATQTDTVNVSAVGGTPI